MMSVYMGMELDYLVKLQKLDDLYQLDTVNKVTITALLDDCFENPCCQRGEYAVESFWRYLSYAQRKILKTKVKTMHDFIALFSRIILQNPLGVNVSTEFTAVVGRHEGDQYGPKVVKEFTEIYGRFKTKNYDPESTDLKNVLKFILLVVFFGSKTMAADCKQINYYFGFYTCSDFVLFETIVKNRICSAFINQKLLGMAESIINKSNVVNYNDLRIFIDLRGNIDHKGVHYFQMLMEIKSKYNDHTIDAEMSYKYMSGKLKDVVSSMQDSDEEN